MFNSINVSSGAMRGLPPNVSPEQFQEEIRAAQAGAAQAGAAETAAAETAAARAMAAPPPQTAFVAPPASSDQPNEAYGFLQGLLAVVQKDFPPPPPPPPLPTFNGTPDQVAQEITQQFIWGEQQTPVPNAGLQQALDALPAALAKTSNSLDQQMIGLAESQLANCHNMAPAYNREHPRDLIIFDDINAQLALEIAEQPDNAKHALSQRVRLPNGDNFNLVVGPDGKVLCKKEHGTFFSQVMGVVDNIVTPIVDAAAFIPVLTPFLAPVAIGLNVVEGSQQLAEGNILGGMLDIAAAAAGGVGEYFNTEAAALKATDSIAATADRGTALIAGNVLKGVSAAQGLKGTIQAGIQGDGLAAFASAVGGIGGSGALGGGTGIGNLSRDALVASSLAGAGVAIKGGNALQALSAVTSAAGEAGLFQNTPPAPALALNNRPAATQAYTDPVIPVTATALPDLTPNAAGSGAYGLNGSLGNLIDQSIIGSADSAAFSQPIQEDKGQLGSSGQISNAEVNLGPGFGLPGAGGGAAGPYFEMVPSANSFGGSASSNTQPNNSNNAQMPPDIGSGSGPSSPGSVASAFRYVFGPVNPQEWEANGALAGGLAGGIVGGGIGGAGGAFGGALGGTLVAPGVGTAGGAIAGGDAGALAGIGIGAAAGAGAGGMAGLVAGGFINYMEGDNAQGNNTTPGSATPNGAAPSVELGSSGGGPGEWVVSPKYPSTNPDAAAYQQAATGAPAGVEYAVPAPQDLMSTGIKYFDGYDPATNSLIDAKNWNNYPPDFLISKELTNLAVDADIAAFNGNKLEVRVSSQATVDRLTEALKVDPIPNVIIHYWPAN